MVETSIEVDAPAPVVRRGTVRPAAPRPASLAHLVLQTSAYESMKTWYVTVLNAGIVFEGEGICFLSFDEEHHRIAIKASPGLKRIDRGTVGVHHFAFTHATLADLLGTYVRLRDAGVRPFWTIHHGMTVSMYYRDPDGNQVELQVDTFESKAAATAFLRSEQFKANPIGVTYDADELVRAFEAGTGLADLLRQPALPPGKTPGDMRPSN
jgi:catechol-2,3-dioxygenase